LCNMIVACSEGLLGHQVQHHDTHLFNPFVQYNCMGALLLGMYSRWLAVVMQQLEMT
jgi:hypothetical protein